MIVLGAVLPVFALIAVGLLLRRVAWLTPEADQSMLRVNINLLFPCLIIDAALGNPAFSQWRNLLLAPLAGFATVAAGMLLARWAWGRRGAKNRRVASTFAVTTGIYNYSYVPIPLSLLLFPAGTTAVLFLFNVGVEFAMWTLGVMLFTGAAPGRDWRKLLNGPLVGILLVLLLNGLGWQHSLPAPVITGIRWLGQCAIPISLLIIGAVVADHWHEFGGNWGWRTIGGAALLRLLLLPLLFLLLARWLPASNDLKRVLVLQAAMPSAMFPIVMSRHYGGDPPTALRVVLGTSLLGLLTIPLWIHFGLRLAAVPVRW